MSDTTAQIDREIAVLQQRILNAATLNVARRLHDQLDLLRERRAAMPADAIDAAYERGYQAGYHAGIRRVERSDE